MMNFYQTTYVKFWIMVNWEEQHIQSTTSADSLILHRELSDREKQIMELRFGFKTGNEKKTGSGILQIPFRERKRRPVYAREEEKVRLKRRNMRWNLRKITEFHTDSYTDRWFWHFRLRFCFVYLVSNHKHSTFVLSKF